MGVATIYIYIYIYCVSRETIRTNLILYPKIQQKKNSGSKGLNILGLYILNNIQQNLKYNDRVLSVLIGTFYSAIIMKFSEIIIGIDKK